MDDDAKAKDEDVLFLHSPTEDGEGIRVLRARKDRVETGEVRALQEGKPIAAGEVVKLKPRADHPRVCDVDVVQTIAPPARDAHGPAQVATKAYRESWERIFGARDGALN